MDSSQTYLLLKSRTQILFLMFSGSELNKIRKLWLQTKSRCSLKFTLRQSSNLQCLFLHLKNVNRSKCLISSHSCCCVNYQDELHSDDKAGVLCIVSISGDRGCSWYCDCHLAESTMWQRYLRSEEEWRDWQYSEWIVVVNRIELGIQTKEIKCREIGNLSHYVLNMN